MFRLPTPLASQIADYKRRFRFVFFGAPLLGTLACGGGGGGDATVTAPVVPPAASPPVVPPVSTAWSLDATIFTNADFGGKAGGLADVSVVRLNDGRFRMFIGANPLGSSILSAISTDGVKFTLESGERLTSPMIINGKSGSFRHRPAVVRADDGRLKLFGIYVDYLNNGFTTGIYSFTSTDEGLNWTLDPGVRLTLAATGFTALATGEIVKAKGGGWRFYFSNDPPTVIEAGTGRAILGDTKIASAFSSDLVTFTMDPGIRIGIGASTLTGNGQTPGAVVNADGSTSLVFFRNTGAVTMQSTSTDGLNFTTESKTDFGGQFPWAADTFLLPLANGDVRLYFNHGDSQSGTIYTGHRTAFTASQ